MIQIARETADLTTPVRDWIRALNPEFWAQVASLHLQIGARDESGELVSGALGEVKYGVLYIVYVGIAPSHRRQGLGRQLMAELECQARENGAVSALVTTLEFEAPIFYQKQGYTLLGVLGAPPGSRKMLLSKDLETTHGTS